ncbi:mediator of RNA polymerase II transcription subunit 1.1-like [Manduca sexta]|uniref:mediator of RNA polymerase II transcription subunit 1.1-like n=1 Tax=Manduca sexta TaxID=7130 RepID=UPI0018904896|nr:mediator of RNA polymerase II transcription subunit 1.1-like [Manduca sexta]
MSQRHAEGTGGADLQRKLDLLNGTLDAERAEQARRQMQYIAHSGYSEDSDYTSDLNYPVGQHANCSASQFRSAAHQMHTPQRSLEASRENSYERDEYHIHGDTDPLYYNSQPRTNRIETWSQLHAQASVESAISWRTAADWQSGEEQRRPSLERQNTLYDDSMGFGYDTYTATTHIRDHSHLSQQASYEEYYDSSSYPYPTYVDDSRQWDSGGQYGGLYDYGLTPTEYENIVNKRRSSVVQLPQVPTKQSMMSSRYSDYNEMAPYRPRPRRTAASLPATPSSTPKRGRVLPVPPGSDASSVRSRGRRLPRPPPAPAPVQPALPAAPARLQPAPPAPAPAALVHTHVPYVPEPEKVVTSVSYGYDSYGYQSEYQDTATEQFQDNNYTTSYDEDGMQPFFDETPHATPPAAAQKTPWTETETSTQFTYPVASEGESLLPKSVPSTISSYLPQPPVTSQQEIYQDQNYQRYDYQYDSQQYQYEQQDQYHEQHQYQEKNDYQYQQQYQDEQTQHQISQQYDQEQQYEDEQYQYQQQQNQQYQQQQEYEQEQQLEYQQQQQFQQQKDLQQQQQQQQQQLQHQQQQQQQKQQQLLQQQQQQQQQKQPAQQLQSSVLTGAATLGSLMAGGAKKLGSFFGAAAAAVAAPSVPQPPQQSIAVTTAPTTQFTSSVAPVTPFTSTIPVTTSVPEVSPAVPTSTATTTVPTLPRTPSLKRQESIQRPSVRRTRTLPDAPEDLAQSSIDESAYEDEYHKTEYEQTIERDRTSLERYRDEEYPHDLTYEEEIEERRMSEAPSSPRSPSIQKTASPTRSLSQMRKPSVDSYHSQTPSIIDRRTSQSSFHHEEKVAVVTTQEETITEKSKVTFQDSRTTYHEVPEENDRFQTQESFDEHVDEYQDDTYREDDTFHEQDEKFDDQDQFQRDDQYQEDSVFQEQERHDEQAEFQPEQPKLTPKQRWHRAYNKIVMQLNGTKTLRKRWRKRARPRYRHPAGDRGPIDTAPIDTLYANSPGDNSAQLYRRRECVIDMFRSRKGQAISEADVRRDQAYQSRSVMSGSRLRVRRGSSLTDLDKLRCSGGSSGGGSIGDLMNMFSGSATSVGSDTLVARTVPLETVRRNIPPMTTPPSRPPSSPLIHVSRPLGPLTMAQRTLRFSRLLKYQPCSADVLITLVSY